MSLKVEILDELRRLIAEGKRLNESYKNTVESAGAYYSDLAEHEFRAFATSSFSAIERIASEDSQFFKTLPKFSPTDSIANPGYSITTVPAIIGCLQSLADAAERGLLESLESRLRANIHDDFLQQAKSLLGQDYYVAAMVLVGGVLEDHLEKLIAKHTSALPANGSISKYNDALHGVAYEKPVWRRIQQIGDVRNYAAHGDFVKVKRDDVDDALTFVGRFLADNPA